MTSTLIDCRDRESDRDGESDHARATHTHTHTAESPFNSSALEPRTSNP